MLLLKLGVGIGVSTAIAGILLSQAVQGIVAQRAVATRLEGTAGSSAPSTFMPILAARSPQASSSPWTTTIDPDPQGQFRADMELGGRALSAIIDTGATYVALSADDAEAAGVRVPASAFTATMQTANGRTRAAPVILPLVRVGNVEARNVEAVVTEPGALTGVSLVGMSFLRKLSGYQVQSGRLILQQ